ncbi:MAG: hypothetical protein IPM25_02035 [Chloracidobacterium sp.]|nr:hypothetical protein [Chloracidobacterium sp.]
MAIVSELLINGGVLPELEAAQRKSTILNKKNGVVFSIGWFIFFTMFVTSIWGILDVEELAGISAVTGVFGGLIILIASLVFLPSSKIRKVLPMTEIRGPASAPAGLYGVPAHPALGVPQQQPIEAYGSPQGSWRTPDTGELIERGSVTESTTKLLKRDE